MLIVEDHPLNMKLFRVLLHSRGYETVEARDGTLRLDLARAENPDLIIMDFQLPDVSGIEIIRALQGDDRTRDIPIVAITASMPDEEATSAPGRDAFCANRSPARSFSGWLARCCGRSNPAADPALLNSARKPAMMR